MRRLIFFFILVFSSYFANAQDTAKCMALVEKQTATWCYYCGTWGWDLQKLVVQDCKDKAVVMQMHDSNQDDLLYSSTAATLLSKFPKDGYSPSWYVNGVTQTAVSGSGSISQIQTRLNIVDAVDQTTLSEPLIGISFAKKELTGSVLKVTATTKFVKDYKSANGAMFKLGIYVIEDGVVNYQNGQGNYAVHDDLLRTSMSKDAMGVEIASGNIKADTVINTDFSLTLNSKWKTKNIHLAAIVWYQTTTKYSFVNAYSDFKSINSTGINESTAKAFVKFDVNPLPFVNSTAVHYVLSENSDVVIKISDIYGKTIKEVINSKQSKGDYKISLNTADIASGIYFCTLQTSKESKTIKIIKE